MSLLAADVIGNGGGCDNGCDKKGGSGDDGALRYFSRVMFKILHIISNICSIKLDEEGGRIMDVATAVTTRATMATTSSDDGGGRGNRR